MESFDFLRRFVIEYTYDNLGDKVRMNCCVTHGLKKLVEGWFRMVRSRFGSVSNSSDAIVQKQKLAQIQKCVEDITDFHSNAVRAMEFQNRDLAALNLQRKWHSEQNLANLVGRTAPDAPDEPEFLVANKTARDEREEQTLTLTDGFRLVNQKSLFTMSRISK